MNPAASKPDRDRRDDDTRTLIRAALAALGIEKLVLSIHDVSFPSVADEDVGRGSPYSLGGAEFLAFVSELGFDGVQFGPQGQTSPANASPYDGSVFSKSLLSVALTELTLPAFGRLLDESEVRAWVAGAPRGDRRAHYAYAYRVQSDAVALASTRLRERAAAGEPSAVDLAARVASFAAAAPWLRHDALFEAVARENGTDDWRSFPLLDRDLAAHGSTAPNASNTLNASTASNAGGLAFDAAARARVAALEKDRRDVIDAWAFGQFVLDAQHRSMRAHARSLGLSLYGDLQVGLSLRDTWSRARLFLADYVMGAPPSRTNPEGQPWGYPLFDPRGARTTPEVSGGSFDQSALTFVRARIDKLYAEFDGVRIDHPHGLVCPWVYDARFPDDPKTVADGARLFESPGDARHPSLASLAIVRPEQIDADVPAYADERVRWLDDAQIDEYAVFFDVVASAAMRHGRPNSDILCEVLSTCPLPLRAVMARHGLGRFRVTQKASLTDETDGYRSENAEPDDWIMIGNHDTDPLLLVVDRWQRGGTFSARANYLAGRLEPDPSRRAALAARLAADAGGLVLAMGAELFASRAKHVMIFFADLFGAREVYNTPGVIRDDNWTLRVPRAYREAYAASLERGEALDLPAALALAMRSRGASFADAHRNLIAALEARASRL